MKQRRLDLNAASGFEVTTTNTTPLRSKGVMLNDQITTSANARELSILVAPYNGSSQVYLSAIEVTRRDDQ